MAEAVVDALEAVEIEIDEAGVGPVALGKGGDPPEFAHEGPPVQHRGQHVAVGQAFHFAKLAFEAADLAAQVVDFAEQGLQRPLHAGGQFRFGEAEKTGLVGLRRLAGDLGPGRRQGAPTDRRKGLRSRA